ncbi:DUF3261 domain-containing protein [Acinetobacter sp. ANC 3903]|uniref:DUF3261 domain-containing protein n=1 Tax=Acinetobacter sp. ANC 3903 TaxID=1977883 RepID=UPI000A33DDE9|nr:DUF3261 domain-containing protein [Acinetobacter sp. ANC 3903]OTG64166.1 DUF3261 domain-containing protein [Acinetobacter sp. ANC 3903]
MKLKWTVMLISAVLLCGGCQSMLPQAPGLATAAWAAQNYQRQDQLEIQWKEQSFSFLLYQQQQGSKLEMLALTLTGQQLFKLSFDGRKVHVEQRIAPMKLLPFEFVVRDILYATYPNFAQLQQQNVRIETSAPARKVFINQQHVLNIQQQGDAIELNNVQVPYQMVISPINDGLANTDADSTE